MKKFLSLSLSNGIESVTARASEKPYSNFKSLTYFLTARNMGSLLCKNTPDTEPTTSNKSREERMDSKDFVEDVVCKEDDLKENEMKVFDIKDAGKVLLVRQNGKISALGTKCTHYSAPLDKGALGQGIIRCQWHGACFNIMTGDIEDFPGMDSLPCFQVSVVNKNIKVKAKRSELEGVGMKRIKTMSKRDPSNNMKIVVIGGGPSGAVCVETLRQEGYTGIITLVNKENSLPYDRIKVSKMMDITVDKLQLRTKQFYDDNNIDTLINTYATKVDTENKKVHLNNDTILDYDYLYLATGANARLLGSSIPGYDLPNIYTVRGFEDGHRIVSMLTPETNVVCLGTGFIGMEAAAFCAGKAKSVTVVGRDSAPFKMVFGETVGKRVMKLFEEKGVKFYMNSGFEKINSENGKITNINLKCGDVIPADIIIIGLGATMSTEFLDDSGIDKNEDGSISVNEYLQTNKPGVFAGGDIAKAPVFASDNAPAAIGHWGLAHYHGRIAAFNILGKTRPLRTVPYFWTMLFGKSLRYCGHGRADDIRIVGNVDELKYYAFHLKGDRVIAMSSCTYDPLVSQFANYLAEGKQLYKKDIEEDPLAWTK